MSITRKIAVIPLLLGLVGCASTRQALTEHPRPVVRYPARVGEQIGALLGFPLAILLSPVTALASFGEDRESQAWAPLAPVLFARNVASTAIGGIPWLLFGWWGNSIPEQSPLMADIPQTESINLPRTETELQNAVLAYYSLWHGVKAPGTELLTSATGRPLLLSQFHGSRLLLYSFDGGDFCNSIDMDVLVGHLRPLHDAVKNNPENLSAIGFTYGVMFSFPFIADLPPSVAAVATFPVVNMTKIDLAEPYALLARMPSSILIDREGIIVDIRCGHLDREAMRDILILPAWSQTLRCIPADPPSFIKDYSQRKPSHYYVYAEALPPGHLLKDNDIGRTNVFSKLLLPEGRIPRKSNAIGKTLRNAVQAGQAIRESDFN